MYNCAVEWNLIVQFFQLHVQRIIQHLCYIIENLVIIIIHVHVHGCAYMQTAQGILQLYSLHGILISTG